MDKDVLRLNPINCGFRLREDPTDDRGGKL